MTVASAVNNTLTPDDVQSFWDALDRWQGEMGLLDWRIVKSPKEARGVMAQMSNFDWKQRQVTCRVGLNWKSSPINASTIEQTAVHELLHVLLYSLVEAARNNASLDDIASAEHSVINTLERLLIPDGESA